MSSLREVLADVLPDYEIPHDDLVGEVLIPAMSAADETRIGAGFFSSQCLAQIAPGLAAALSAEGSRLKLMMSPEIGDEDRQAIERGLRAPEDVLQTAAQTLFLGASLSPSAVARHAAACLSYLIAAERIEIRVVLMRQGMFHKKQWLFRQGTEWSAVHGSGNATARGLLVNGEQMTVDRPWMDGDSSHRRVERFVTQWDRQWNNRDPFSLAIELSSALPFFGTRPRGTTPPTVLDFWKAWDEDHRAGLEPELPHHVLQPERHLLSVPAGIEWRTGRFGHQGEAVDALVAAEGRGVLSIATGGGKSRTALIASVQFQDAHSGPMLILITVPSRPLMRQWAGDITEFGLQPVILSDLSRTERAQVLQELSIGLRLDGVRTEVLIVSNALLASDETLQAFLRSLPDNVEVVFVGDEMHNLGAPRVQQRLPERADRRIGLSATPIRQYDPEGTDALFSYFGPPVFEFDLADAIRSGCLVPYRYHLHEVALSDTEHDRWVELTEELRRAGFRTDDDGGSAISNPKVERLLRERRAVLEQASGKLDVLRGLLSSLQRPGFGRCLIYTSAKKPAFDDARQIEQVNRLLARLGIVSHQLTGEETSSDAADQILEAFGRGDYQVLTAMKVLDEGVNIPQTDTAFLLASSTVRREWVQRRGRILRTAPGKTLADLHDFLMVPPDPSSAAGASILRGELARALEFANLATNEWDTHGPRSVISRYETALWRS